VIGRTLYSIAVAIAVPLAALAMIYCLTLFPLEILLIVIAGILGMFGFQLGRLFYDERSRP
jgi:uncharacterized membrane protein